MTTQESEERFKRPGAPLTGQSNVSPIMGKEHTEEEENVTRDELEEDMKVFEQEWAARGKATEVTEPLDVKE